MRIRSEADVVVCGGGTAGAIAAIAAARTGARSLLIDQYGTVGGMASTGMSFLGVSDAGGRRALGGIGGGAFPRPPAGGAAVGARPRRPGGPGGPRPPLRALPGPLGDVRLERAGLP